MCEAFYTDTFKYLPSSIMLLFIYVRGCAKVLWESFQHSFQLFNCHKFSGWVSHFHYIIVICRLYIFIALWKNSCCNNGYLNKQNSSLNWKICSSAEKKSQSSKCASSKLFQNKVKNQMKQPHMSLSTSFAFKAVTHTLFGDMSGLDKCCRSCQQSR